MNEKKNKRLHDLFMERFRGRMATIDRNGQFHPCTQANDAVTRLPAIKNGTITRSSRAYSICVRKKEYPQLNTTKQCSITANGNVEEKPIDLLARSHFHKVALMSLSPHSSFIPQSCKNQKYDQSHRNVFRIFVNPLRKVRLDCSRKSTLM